MGTWWRKCKHFPRYWPLVRGIHRSPVNSPHKGQWRGALMFSLICAWIKSWVNNREAGDLRRDRTHYDVTVMNIPITPPLITHAIHPQTCSHCWRVAVCTCLVYQYLSGLFHWHWGSTNPSETTSMNKVYHQWPLLLTWFNFNPSMDK